MIHRDQADRLRLMAGGQAPARPPGARRLARTIAIASGKGGVGKTNLTVNLGLALARKGAVVTIVDLDLGLANIDVILGVSAPRTLREVIDGECDLAQVLLEGPYGLHLVCGGSGIVELTTLSAPRREHLVQSLSVIDDISDIVLLDIAAGISPTVLDFVSAAGEVIVVTTTEPTAMTDAYALIKVASQRARGTIFNLVVNQVTSAKEAEGVALTLAGVARRFLGIRLTPLAYLPYDDKLSAAVKQQVPVLIAYPSCRLSSTIDQLATRLATPGDTPATIRPTAGFSGFLRRLTGRVA